MQIWDVCSRFCELTGRRSELFCAELRHSLSHPKFSLEVDLLLLSPETPVVRLSFYSYLSCETPADLLKWPELLDVVHATGLSALAVSEYRGKNG